MKDHTLHFFMLCTFIIFMYASVMQGTVYGQDNSTLKFSTKQTRELWQICATSFRNLNPGLGPNVYFPVCDCYVDFIRSNHTPKEVMSDSPNSMGVSQEEYSKLSQNLRKACNPNINPTEKFTKWEYHQPILVAKNYLALVVEKISLTRRH